jgi:outer membrane protein assembly factor BamA
LKGVSEDIGKSNLLGLMDTGDYNFLGSKGFLQDRLFLKDIKSILSYYKKNGYLHVNIEKFFFNFYYNENYLDIIIVLNEGKKIEFFKPIIYGFKNNKEIKDMQKYLKSAETKGFDSDWFKYNANAIQQYYESIGYPLSIVEAYIELKGKKYLFYPLSNEFTSEEELLSNLSGKVNLSYKIKRGPKKKFGSIFISGNFLTKEDTIKNEILFKQNETLSLDKITKTENRLRSLGVFKTISMQIPSLNDQNGIKDDGVMPVDVLFFLQEGENRYIDFLVSTSTNELWSFSTKIVEKNLFGYAKKVSLLGKVGEIYSKLELGFESPNIFSTEINLSIKTYYKYETPPAFNLTVIGNEISFFKRFFKKLTLSPSILFEYSKTEISFSKNIYEPDIFQNTETALTNSMKISLFYENRDSLFDPRKGFSAKYSFQWAGLFDQLSDKLIDLININVSNEKFLKNEFDFSFYISPLKWLTFANSIRIGIGIPLTGTKENIPHKDGYFLGGDSTIRGYDFNMAGVIEDGRPLGNNTMLLLNSEVRFYLKNNISIALFADVGGLAQKFSEFFTLQKWKPVDSYSMFYSLGFGIRYITIVGPLRFDFVPTLNNSYINKGTTFWHFNFSYPF